MAQANEREHGNERVDACEREWEPESAWDEWRQARENGREQVKANGQEPARETEGEQAHG